jgi:WhiB family redox-sensing transcriptional regulator
MTERERRALLKRRPNISSWALLFAQARAAQGPAAQAAVSA